MPPGTREDRRAMRTQNQRRHRDYRQRAHVLEASSRQSAAIVALPPPAAAEVFFASPRAGGTGVSLGEVFISHTHTDAELAHALSAAIRAIFGDQLETTYSTKYDLEGSPKFGEDWFRWIIERVQQATVAVILIAPASVQKPWVLWEAGAVYGSGVASAGGADTRKVRPLLFRLTGNQVPAPFARLQNATGDDRGGIERFLLDLLQTFGAGMGHSAMVAAGMQVAATCDTYVQRVERALRDAPLLPTEATVQEWCERIDDLTRESRLSEVAYLHDWLNVAFGRGPDESPLPLDLRIHRRLGAAYLAANEPLRAIEQFKLGLTLTPRDIFLLRACGQAQLDANQFEAAAQTVERITTLDAKAFTHNVECAALKGRLQRRQNNLEGAADTYRRALDNHPDSYYLADVLAQAYLQMGKIDEARAAYRRAGHIIDGLAERNIWTYATRATAALVDGDYDRVVAQLRAAAALRASPDEIERILRGLADVCAALGLDQAKVQGFEAALRAS